MRPVLGAILHVLNLGNKIQQRNYHMHVRPWLYLLQPHDNLAQVEDVSHLFSCRLIYHWSSLPQTDHDRMTILVPVLDLFNFNSGLRSICGTTPLFYVYQVCHSYAYPSNMTLISIVLVQVLAVNQFECIFFQFALIFIGSLQGARVFSFCWFGVLGTARSIDRNFLQWNRLILKLFGYGDSTAPRTTRRFGAGIRSRIDLYTD